MYSTLTLSYPLVISFKRASGRFSFNFREVYQKCIEHIGKFLIQMRRFWNFGKKWYALGEILGPISASLSDDQGGFKCMLMSSWCLCSFPIWCLGQKCQFSRALLIYGLGLKVDERQWSETVRIKFLIKHTLKLRMVSCIKQHKERAKRRDRSKAVLLL